MRISRIHIENFRNFHLLDVPVGDSAVILGENQIGKTNLIYALRLLLDPSLPDNARQLKIEDYWDGLKRPLSLKDKIKISVDISDFEQSESELAILAEHLVQPVPMVARLTYEFGPIPSLKASPSKDEDFEFTVYGGDRPENRIGYDIRKWLPVEVLPALRDTEADLSRWTRSPLKPLLDRAKGKIDSKELEEASERISSETEKVAQLVPISELAQNINQKLVEIIGGQQSISMALGFSPTDPNKLLRTLRILFDNKKREISEASLGTANVLYLALRTLDLKSLAEEGSREHTFFCIEEPEAHLHPHLQRLVYSSYLRQRQPVSRVGVEAGVDSKPEAPNKIKKQITYFLTSHSPHIASVAPVKSIILLKRDKKESATIGVSGATISLSEDDRNDIERYLDVSRAEGLFARGILLVEGDAEKFLIPVLADRAGYNLDELGITVCSVSGADFVPYVKFFGPKGLNIPTAIITDRDPKEEGGSRGEDRACDLILPEIIDKSSIPEDREKALSIAKENGVFLNQNTFEIDLIKCGYWENFSTTMRELCTVKVAVERAKARCDAKAIDDNERFIKDIKYVGKGRFAQRLAQHIAVSKCTKCPDYILEALKYVTK